MQVLYKLFKASVDFKNFSITEKPLIEDIKTAISPFLLFLPFLKGTLRLGRPVWKSPRVCL